MFLKNTACLTNYIYTSSALCATRHLPNPTWLVQHGRPTCSVLHGRLTLADIFMPFHSYALPPLTVKSPKILCEFPTAKESLQTHSSPTSMWEKVIVWQTFWNTFVLTPTAAPVAALWKITKVIKTKNSCTFRPHSLSTKYYQCLPSFCTDPSYASGELSLRK